MTKPRFACMRLILVLIAFFISVSCTSVRTVEVPAVRTKFDFQRDTVVMRDTTVIRERQYGDTVYVDRYRVRYVDRIKERVVERVDTVTVVKTVTVEKRDGLLAYLRFFADNAFLLLLILVLLAWFVPVLIRRIRNAS